MESLTIPDPCATGRGPLVTLTALSAVGRGAPCQLPTDADTLEPWREGREDSQVVLDVGPEQVLAKQTQQKHPVSLGGRGGPLRQDGHDWPQRGGGGRKGFGHPGEPSTEAGEVGQR